MASPERAEYCISKAGRLDDGADCSPCAWPRNIGVFEIRPGIIATP
jgi:hypothetical protein